MRRLAGTYPSSAYFWLNVRTPAPTRERAKESEVRMEKDSEEEKTYPRPR